MVLHHAEREEDASWRFGLPWDGGRLPVFWLIAVRVCSGVHIWEDVPFTLVVDEEAFALVVALGQELERRLAEMVEE